MLINYASYCEAKPKDRLFLQVEYMLLTNFECTNQLAH